MLRLYRVFWHQLMRKAFTSHATVLVRRVVNISTRNNLSRHLVLLFSFLIVALMHVFASPTPSLCLAWPQLRYYGSNVMAIVAEDTIIRLCSRVEVSTGKTRVRSVTKGKFGDITRKEERVNIALPNWRWLGYLWVMAFDIWATSKLVYATAKCT